MNITEAGIFQDAFTAVENGTASDAQCTEVQAVAKAMRAYLQEAELRSRAIPQRRRDFEDILSDGAKAALTAALPVDTTSKPRLVIDPVTGDVGAPAQIKAAPIGVELAPAETAVETVAPKG